MTMHFTSYNRRFVAFTLAVLGGCFLVAGPAVSGQKPKRSEQKPQETKPFQGHESSISALAVTADGQTLVTGSFDNDIRIWDLTTGKERKKLRGHPGGIHALALSPDEKLLASTSCDPFVKLWNISNGRERHLLKTDYRIWCLGFTPDGKALVAGGEGPLKVWDVATGQELRTLEVVKSPTDGRPILALSLAISADGNSVYVGHGDGAIRLYDLSTGKVLGIVRASNNVGVSSLVLSPDHKTLACIVDGFGIALLNLPTGTERFRIKSQDAFAWCLVFSQGGKILVSGGMDGSIKFWDVGTGQPGTSFKASSTDRIRALVFHPNGKTLISGGGAQLKPAELKLWDVAAFVGK
jgi:WD40 repeat protein